MQLVAGLSSLGLPSLFSAAEKRIILHAGVYGPFAASAPHREGLATALERPSFERLDIVTVRKESVWAAPFMKAIRFGESVDSHAETQAASTRFLHTLQANHPGKVHIHPQTTIPCLPIIIVDNTILFGQYAHSEERAANGFWGRIEADVDILSNGLPDNATEEVIAAYRLVSECRNAMNGGKH